MDAKSRNAFIADMPKKQMIKYAAENEHIEDTFTKSEKMHKRYQELASKFDFEAYIPLIPTFGFFCSVTLEDIVPQNIGEISARDLISFVNKRKDERKLLREKFDELTNHLAKISNIQHAGQVSLDFVNDLIASKAQYRQSMDKWKDISAFSISTGVPISLTALGTFAALKGNPFSIAEIAGCLAIGAICSYADFYRAKKNRDPSYSSYLIGIDELCRNITR